MWGLAAAVLMAVPSNVGAVGLAFALASLLPWSVFAVLTARRLLELCRGL
jgi:Flp pilus assembly protein TadB